MRADRLLSLMMLLQARGRLTAAELAGELGVTERTVYRDIEALSRAGVPVYGQPGPGGGFALVDSYRTSLTGLTTGEVRALFMLSVPAPLAELGVSDELRAALRKLAAALPVRDHLDERQVRQRIHLDATWWRQGHEPLPHLRLIQEAVWQDRRLVLVTRPLGAATIERLVEPLGLVAKAGVWYLVYGRAGRVRATALSELLDVRPTAELFARPGDFDLADFWTGWSAAHEAGFQRFTATVRVTAAAAPELARRFGQSRPDQVPVAGGWVTLELPFASFEEARARLLGYGRAVEVIGPRSLRRSIHDYAEQIVDLYAAQD